ncbi:hypothetical protein [Variovorax sp. LG9.2]|uniref:hypothetical protein n=1 Tax=Variovorax sp. LG9.2 TaxID=3048626 RepID=UPI002B2395C1|nr:hypothetical protein [Variovorax sp. LG9.2]MEB0056714.1 hypothetical protein [Variovorax sp. LG9.2]
MSKITWRKSASKDVRPFFGAATLENSTDTAEIRLFEDGEFSGEMSYLVEPSDASRLAITIRPHLSAPALLTGTIKRGDLVLAVSVLQPFLKKTVVIGQYPVSHALPDEIAVGAEVLEQLGGGSNVVIEVALCLAKRLSKTPGSPFLLGHWLSKKSFALRVPKPVEVFNVIPMSDKDWEAMGWPAKTMYSVDYIGGFNDPAAKDRPLANVRVHSDVHRKLTLESSQRLAKPIEAALAAEITAQIVASSLHEWQDADDVVPLSPLSAFMKRLDAVQKTSFAELKKLAMQPGMAKLKALLHSSEQTVRFIKEG